jgi:hypothetical protein
MKRIVDKEELRVGWLLNHWYEKVVFVFGWAWAVIFTVAFMVGFIQELIK